MSKKINIALVGLGFGAEFIPIYQAHPNANLVAVCQRDPKKLRAIQEAFGIAKGYTDYDELLRDPEIHAVHINTPIPDHAPQSIKALKAGKHVACTVPMATSIEDCRKIVDLTKKTGLKYMMMETVVYAREYLYIKELYDKGELGKIQFLQASHQQDMDGWPNYWPGLPPMWYATHCVGPMLALTDAVAEYVSCFGSGTVRKELIKHYGSPFAVETAHVKLRDSDLTARIIRFSRCRPPIPGEHRCVRLEEIVRVDADRARGARPAHANWPGAQDPEKIQVPDYAKRLPAGIRKFTTKGVYDLGKKTHLSFTQGAGHGGLQPRTSPTSFSPHWSRTAIPTRTRSSPPTGLALASAPTSPRSLAARS
jgi:predicted dehydrogenase